MKEQNINWPSQELLADEEKKIDKWREKASTHRFFPPENEFAHDRLSKFKEIFTDFQKKHPEIVGLTLHGSNIRGKATERSDFDGTIYFEATEKDRIPISQNMPEQLETDFDVEFRSYKENDSVNELLETWKNSLNLSVGQLEHIHDWPINNKLINFAVKDWGDSDYAVTYIARMFHLSIETGLDKFRDYFLDKVDSITSSEEEKDIIWQRILRKLKEEESGREFRDDRIVTRINEKGERTWIPFQNPEDKRGYPKTFKEALEKYHTGDEQGNSELK